MLGWFSVRLGYVSLGYVTLSQTREHYVRLAGLYLVACIKVCFCTLFIEPT